MTEKPYSEEIEGEDRVGVLFVAGEGRFYEFVDPDEHELHALFRDPRDGKEIEMDSVLDKSIKSVMGGYQFDKLPLDEWMSMREKYLKADEEDMEEYREKSSKAWRNVLEDMNKEKSL